MRRRALLAALGGTVRVAGCSDRMDPDDWTDPEVGPETLTPAPVPTDRSTPGGGPAADLSALGVADAKDLGERHWRTLSDGPHGFERDANVLENGESIRSLRVAVRSTAGADAYHFVFDAEDTRRYPTRPAEPYFEMWDDGTTYQRYGRTDPEFAVSDGRLFSAPSTQTTERYRIQLLFSAFEEAAIEPVPGGYDVRGSVLRRTHDVTPARLRVLSSPRDATLEASVAGDATHVAASDLALDSTVSNRAVDVEETVRYLRFDDPPEPPSWVEAAAETVDEDET